MFDKINHFINSKPFVITNKDIRLAESNQYYIEIKNPNEFDIFLKVTSYYGFISVQKEVAIHLKKL